MAAIVATARPVRQARNSPRHMFDFSGHRHGMRAITTLARPMNCRMMVPQNNIGSLISNMRALPARGDLQSITAKRTGWLPAEVLASPSPAANFLEDHSSMNGLTHP